MPGCGPDGLPGKQSSEPHCQPIKATRRVRSSDAWGARSARCGLLQLQALPPDRLGDTLRVNPSPEPIARRVLAPLPVLVAGVFIVQTGAFGIVPILPLILRERSVLFVEVGLLVGITLLTAFLGQYPAGAPRGSDRSAPDVGLGLVALRGH